MKTSSTQFQSLFYWITYSYSDAKISEQKTVKLFQSLFYWITYSYNYRDFYIRVLSSGFNPYFIGLPILIVDLGEMEKSLERKVSILILLDYLFL